MRGSDWARFFTLAVLLAAAAGRVRAEAPPTWEDLQARGAVIAGIEIKVTDVFDTSKPDENHWLAHAANFIHIETRNYVISRELLFKAGQKVDARLIHETERNLRAYEFIQDAQIVPEGLSRDSVQARVEVHDSWSLKASLKYGHAGGATTWGVRLDEVNMFGLGKQIILSYEQNPERTIKEIAYVDPRFLGSWWNVELNYATLSDGLSKGLVIQRPFFSLTTPYSLGVRASDVNEVETFYNYTSAAFAYPAHLNSADLFGAWAYSVEGRTAFRAGFDLRLSDGNYGAKATYRPSLLPDPDVQPRRFRGLEATWAMLQDRYATFQNMAGIKRTEDYNLGWDIHGGVGYYSVSLGSYVNAPFAEAEVKKGWRLGGDSLFLLDSWLQGRHQPDGWHDSLTHTEFTLYNQSLPYQTLAADLYAVYSTRPDPEDWLYFGGPDGMRGYKDHFLSGDRRWVFSFEDRVITKWSLWGLLQVGFVGYTDVGAIRQFDTGAWSKTYADVGAGLRFGNLKSAWGRVIQVSVAMPVVRAPGEDKYQIFVGNVARF